MASAAQHVDDQEPLCVLNLDIKRAHFYAKARRPVFVELPAEDPRSSDPEACGELLFSLYGTRDAASNWEEEYSEYLVSHKFRKGVACPCHFYNEETNVRILVHGDDFLGVGTEAHLRDLTRILLEKYEAVHEIIGPGKHLPKTTKIIGRHISFVPGGVDIEVDKKYIESSIEAYGLEKGNSAASPAVKVSNESKEERSALMLRRVLGRSQDGVKAYEEAQKAEGAALSEELDFDDAKKFQSIAAKLNFVAPALPEALFATKECMRAMAKPTKADEEKLRRLLRFYKGRPRAIIRMRKGGDISKILTYVDADFAGCPTSRRSTCGGCIVWAGCMIKSWSKTISTLALSSGESELAAMSKGAAEAMGLESIFQDFGCKVGVELHSDATAAIGIASRQGLGRIRHVAVADLWIQQRLKAGCFSVHKVPGNDNVSDLMTKALDAPRIDMLLERMGIETCRDTGL